MRKTTLWWRKTQIEMAAEHKIPIEELKPPLNEEEKEEYYSVIKEAEKFRRENGFDCAFYIPDDAFEEDYYIEDKYYDDFWKVIRKCFKECTKGKKKSGKKKKKHK